METHLIKIDTWEFIKGIFWSMWLILKLIWPYLLAIILIKFFLSWLESWIKKRKNKVGFKP
jgi:uncharacterized membrane protein